jgi:hypothetical protein
MKTDVTKMIVGRCEDLFASLFLIERPAAGPYASEVEASSTESSSGLPRQARPRGILYDCAMPVNEEIGSGSGSVLEFH